MPTGNSSQVVVSFPFAMPVPYPVVVAANAAAAVVKQNVLCVDDKLLEHVTECLVKMLHSQPYTNRDTTTST